MMMDISTCDENIYSLREQVRRRAAKSDQRKLANILKTKKTLVQQQNDRFEKLQRGVTANEEKWIERTRNSPLNADISKDLKRLQVALDNTKSHHSSSSHNRGYKGPSHWRPLTTGCVQGVSRAPFSPTDEAVLKIHLSEPELNVVNAQKFEVRIEAAVKEREWLKDAIESRICREALRMSHSPP